MDILNKLDELLTKADSEPVAEPSEESGNTITIQPIDNDDSIGASDDLNANPQNDKIEGQTAEPDMQGENPEDAKQVEAFNRLVVLAEKQQEKIDSLQKQLAILVQGGARMNDGADVPIEHPPAAMPEEYTYLKDLDYNM